MTTEFLASFTATGDARIQLQQASAGSGLFRKATRRILPTAEWIDALPSEAVYQLLDLAARGEAQDRADCIEIPAARVAALDQRLAAEIGLPPPAPLVLSLKGKGLIIQDDFAIESRWTRTNGLAVNATVRGAQVLMDGREFRLPEPLFSLARAAADVNAAPDASAKQAAFAELRQLLESHSDRAILDGALQETRIAFAAHFSLSLGSSGSAFDFDPVLFAPRIGEAASEGATVDEAADNLLTPAQDEAFRRLFRRRSGKQSSYLLPDGLLLFIDREMAEALRVVGEKQRAPAEERRRFAISPRRALAEALGKDEGAFETAFIETAQYSERVIGIDPWRKPVLPWIKPRPNSWLPEQVGIAIGDPPDQQRIEIPLGKAHEAIALVEEAIKAGSPSAALFGQAVPATPAVLQSLQAIAEVEKEAAKAGEGTDPPAEPPPGLREKLFLRVRENFEDVEYAPLVAQSMLATAPAEVPAAVRTSLKPHQIEGFQWLASAWHTNRPGVLLADDMGLGKTLQALTFFSWLKQTEKVAMPILVVAPTGLLANWQEEIDRHLLPGSLGHIVKAYGQGLASMRAGAGTDISTGAPRLAVEEWRSAGIVLTTYETLRDYHMSFARVGFAVVAFDEAQRVKNPAAQVTRAAKTLRCRFALALTGTPVENRLQDLWSVADIVHPSFLSTSKAFEQEYGAADLDKLRQLNARLTTPAGTWPPFMLRRMKTDHLQGLPRKRMVERAKPMPPAQAQAYSDAVNRALLLRGSGGREGVLQTLARLRSISLAPVLPQPGDGFEAGSARLQATFEILEEIRQKGEKALIFCESLELQPLLAVEIRRRFRLPNPVSCISGDVAGDRRQQLVNLFQSRSAGFDVMILSPRAGGVGLTLTAANHVIHLSRWWNPAVEDQATDRVYRIGQEREVTVWLPIAEHPVYGESSFDRKLDALLKRKRDLAQGLLIEPESPDDPEQLLSEVLVEAPPVSAPAPKMVAPAAIPSPSSQSAPVETQAAPMPGLTNDRVKKRPGGEVPWPLFVEPLQASNVRRLDIVDPYAAGSQASCRAVAQFLAGLRERGVKIEAVDLTCF
ncbi:MAG: DEAD/DEAH box helicase, partial [Sphingomonadaceae bacterium]